MRLTPRQLNRATLARQFLLAPERTDVVDAVRRLGGLQAQEPASPYIALWTRLHDLDARTITAALCAHQLVKATLARRTLHIVSSADYRASVTALREVTRAKWMNEQRGLPVRRPLPELAAKSLEYARAPRTNVELRDHAGSLGEPVPADELWRRIRRYAAFLHVPDSEPWGYGRRPVLIDADVWLEAPEADVEASLEQVVRSYLRAFGPASLADISQWSGLAMHRLRVGLDRIRGLVRYLDQSGHDLFDLPGSAIPDEDTPAPPRLLPMWDETLLAYSDRSRLVPEPYRKRVIVKAGDVLPSFIVDGHVAGLWWAEADADEGFGVVLEPFEPLTADAAEQLQVEATRLASFLAPREPLVYARYRHTWRRK